MKPDLPESLESTLRPLFRALPVNRAMTALVVRSGAALLTQTTGDGLAETGEDVRHKHQPLSERHGEHVALVADLLEAPPLAGRPALAAGLWLYVDELDRSHAISQGLQSPTGAFWHAIMHRREGDFSNSKYWYRRAGRHPVISQIDLAGGPGGAGTGDSGFDPIAYVDRVERAHDTGHASPDLVALQRAEWIALFEWCAKEN